VAAIVLVKDVVGGGDIDAATFGDLGKGAIALAMMATLALWGTDQLPERAQRVRNGSEPAVEPKQLD
jgi:hypothetical protein